MLTVASYIGPKLAEVLILGDYADIYFANGHGPRDPIVREMAADEIKSVNEGLDEIDKLFPKARKKYVEGNHEYRFERFINRHCPQLFGVTDIQSLFNIGQRPLWSWIGWSPSQKVRVLDTDLFARHRPQKGTAKATASQALVSQIYGDIHRRQWEEVVGLDNRKVHSICPGWLGNKNAPGIFNYVGGHWQWNLGFALVWSEKGSRTFYPEVISINEHGRNVSCVFQGKRFVE